ncbi:MAG: hypothetical protein KBF73_13330, partial [Flavobacteriales bacterium]|nr:hypothetical protein [Flavobacteriales bacterium]
CERLLFEEFGISIGSEDEILFKRNTFKQAYEYAYEALQSLGEPSTPEEVFDKVSELNPLYESSPFTIRSSMRRRYGFMPIGRTGSFCLKEWEDSRSSFKGGTIREIVRDFLMEAIEPQSYLRITEHVVLYRPESNQKSIIYNLKLDNSDTFKFFKGEGYIGLKNKSYSNDWKPIPNQGSNFNKWSSAYNDLVRFIESNNRMPRARFNKEEERLYIWFWRQSRNNIEGKLDKERQTLINLIPTELPEKKD